MTINRGGAPARPDQHQHLTTANPRPVAVSLFSGIGGLDYGFTQSGFGVTDNCEVDPYRRAVLARHWPDARQHFDVRTLEAADLACSGRRPDVLFGGPPCQDFSVAGRGAGLGGDRGSLAYHFLRLVAETRPRYVVMENVVGLKARGLHQLTARLAASGYMGAYDVVPARAFGASHERERLVLVAWDASDAHPVELRIEPERDQWAGWDQREAERRDWEPVDGRRAEASGWAAKPPLARACDELPPAVLAALPGKSESARRRAAERLNKKRQEALGDAVCPAVAAWLARCIMDAITHQPAAQPRDPQTGAPRALETTQ